MSSSNEIKQHQDALNAILETASQALAESMPDNIRVALELIVSLARYRQDIRTDSERGQA